MAEERKNAACDRKELICRSLDVFLRKRGMTLWVDGCVQSRNDSFGARRRKFISRLQICKTSIIIKNQTIIARYYNTNN